MFNNICFYTLDYQRNEIACFFFLQKVMAYSKIIHNFATQKHKVIEEY